jgi:hypothetical protein
MEEVELREVTDDTGNVSKQFESSVILEPRDFGIDCLAVGITEHSIQVVIPAGVSLVRTDIITKFVLWKVAPKTNMPVEMM